MQNAADAAAIGAEMESERDQIGGAGYSGSGQTADVLSVAQSIASLNGFTDDGGVTTTVAVTSSPTTLGNFNSRYDTLQVTITQKERTTFMTATTLGTISMSASAVSQMPPCMWFLNTKNLVSSSYTLNLYPSGYGSGDIYSFCPASVNGNVYTGSTSGGTIAETLISGASAGSSMGFNIHPLYGAATATDPLASVIAQPTYNGTTCNHTNYSFGTTTSTASSVTLSPGIYCGSASPTGCGTASPAHYGMALGDGTGYTPTTSNYTTVNLNPGLYIITGGVCWQHVNMIGTGVTFFFTKNTSGASYGTVKISTTSQLSISAPTASSGGSIAGILFFLDRNWVNTGPQDFDFDSSGFGGTTSTSQNGNGIWYMPSTGLTMYNGAMGCMEYCPIIADNFVTYGFTIDPMEDFSSISGGNPFRLQSVLVQ